MYLKIFLVLVPVLVPAVADVQPRAERAVGIVAFVGQVRVPVRHAAAVEVKYRVAAVEVKYRVAAVAAAVGRPAGAP